MTCSPFYAPALIARHGLSSILTPDGELLELPAFDLKALLRELPAPLLVHGPASLRILNLPDEPPPAPWFDLLELFLFVYPARSVTPTARGLALALDIIGPEHQAALHAGILHQITRALLTELSTAEPEQKKKLAALLHPLSKGGWQWAGIVADTLGETSLPEKDAQKAGHQAMQVWKRLPEWEEEAPRAQPGNHPVTPQEARQRLGDMLGDMAEPRPGQADFASASCYTFNPREFGQTPNIVLAEAGTGTGKTMGYIAPASLWAEKNDGAVWISTYTRHLQRQIEQELARLYPDPAIRRNHAVIRKGRENYLCLLNLEERITAIQNRASGGNGTQGGAHLIIPLALLVRWAEHTADGDIMGGDLPGWFGELFSHSLLSSVADRRGECIYGACPHYQSCFVEHSIRRARQADLVIANHALVLSQASWNAALASSHQTAPLSEQATNGEPPLFALEDENGLTTHYIFDEGHHIPDAADSAFSLVFSGLEAAELRRWLLGAEGRRSRAKGLRRRFEDILIILPQLAQPLEMFLQAARQTLPAPGWYDRLHGTQHESQSGKSEEESEISASTSPHHLADHLTDNPAEIFLSALDDHLQTRLTSHSSNTGRHHARSRECDLHPVSSTLNDAAGEFQDALITIIRPLKQIIRMMGEKLNPTKLAPPHNGTAQINAEDSGAGLPATDKTETGIVITTTPIVTEEDNTLNAAMIQRLESALRSLYRRALAPLEGWRQMLASLTAPQDLAMGQQPIFIDFIKSEQIGFGTGNAHHDKYDISLNRHWLDPTIPFVQSLHKTTHGLLVTSATLRDRTPEENEEESWQRAEERLGTNWFSAPPHRAALLSPFDYAGQTRTYIITDAFHNLQTDSTNLAVLARSFQLLFECAGGGALGLFTAISRLKAVYNKIHEPLGHQNIPLYGQHCDAMNNPTLIDIFRTEKESCLLGTDAMRDGMDVPGDALKMVVMERTPWPRPDILHRERRRLLSAGQPKLYDDQIARMRLRQAFGRLIRKTDDYGVFVMLDRQTPTRLLSAFPSGISVQRLPLAEALNDISAFLQEKAQQQKRN